jgi:glycosyltransferase involved in cell wall biosynthesis
MTTRPYRPGIPAEILALSHERDVLRRRGQYARADILKQQLEDAGYLVKDNPHGAHLVILPSILVDGKEYRTARQLPSLLDEHDQCTFSVLILAHNILHQARRCVDSILRFSTGTSLEIFLIDNNSVDGTDIWAETLQRREPHLHVIRASRTMGVAEAYNLGLKQSRGRYILLLDACLELAGDIFTPLSQTLANNEVGITGLYGLHTDDLRHFEAGQEQEVEAISGQCMAFRRKLLKRTGLFDEHYRHPYYMDIDFSFVIRDQGTYAVTTAQLPITNHADTQNTELSDAEHSRLTRRNFYRYLGKWGDREDLLPEIDEPLEEE